MVVMVVVGAMVVVEAVPMVMLAVWAVVVVVAVGVGGHGVTARER